MSADPTAPVRAILLDVDDTLVDTRAAMVAAGTAAFTALWPQRSPQDHQRAALRYYEDPQRFFPEYAAGRLPFDDMRVARLREVQAALELAGEPTLASFEEAYVPAFQASITAFPDALRMLERVLARGIPVGLLTNSSAPPTRLKLEVLGLEDRFDVVVTADTLGFGKPDPRVYLHACEQLGHDPAETLCVGDSLEWDVLGAQRAGLGAVWLDRAGGTHPQARSVASLDELFPDEATDLGTGATAR